MKELDLSKIPPPRVVEKLSFKQILSELETDLKKRAPDLNLVPSDPAVKILEVAAYRELMLRARINEAALSLMPAFSSGSDLDNLLSLVAEGRKEGESDDAFRARALLAPDEPSTAGSADGYRYHALSSDPKGRVWDVLVQSPQPSEVEVTILVKPGFEGEEDEVLNLVRTRLSAKDVRPLTDLVEVQAARRIPFTVDAVLDVYPGPGAADVLRRASEALEDYLAARYRLGLGVPLSGLYAALHGMALVEDRSPPSFKAGINPPLREAIRKVELKSPAKDIDVGAVEAAYCEAREVGLAQ